MEAARRHIELENEAEANTDLGCLSMAIEGMQLARKVNTESPHDEIKRSLNHRIIGQPEAVDSIIQALDREKFRNPNRPIASYLFLGPTGVGKSQTAKELAKLLHEGSEHGYLRIDCTQFSEASDMAALVGAPPKYVGREQDPLLDPEVIERDKSVILFDEIEKGHRQLHDLLMQILGDGEITLLNGGQTVSFRNSIVIMTSNTGSRDIMDAVNKESIGFQTGATQENSASSSKKKVEKAVFKSLERQFRPEFIGRINRLVTFSPLSDAQFEEALDRYVEEMNSWEQSVESGVSLSLSPELRGEVVKSSDRRRKLGVRAIIDCFEQSVQSDFINLVLQDGIPANSQVYAVPATNPKEGARSGVEAAFYYKSIPEQPKALNTEKTNVPAPVDSQTMHVGPIINDMSPLIDGNSPLGSLAKQQPSARKHD